MLIYFKLFSANSSSIVVVLGHLGQINWKSWKLGIFREKRGLTGKAWTCFVKMCVLSYPWLTYNPCPGLGQFFKSPQKLSQSSKICLFWPIYHFFPGLTPSRRAKLIFFLSKSFWIQLPDGLRKPKSHQTVKVAKNPNPPIFPLCY